MLGSEKDKPMNGTSTGPGPHSPKASRKIYEKPALVEYGSVAKLTQSGATVSANDGQTHRARRP